MLRNLEVTAPDSKRTYIIDRSNILGIGGFASVFVARCENAPGELFAAKEINKHNYKSKVPGADSHDFKYIHQEHELLQKV